MTRIASPNILGLSGGDHDCAASLLNGTEIVASFEEDKLARARHSAGLPRRAIRYCLQAGGLRPEDIHYVAAARPLYGDAGRQAAADHWIPKRLKQTFPNSKIVLLDHHLCHAAAAYYPSPFDKAGILTLDEKGDWKTGGLWLGEGNSLRSLEDIYYPDSLGNLYSRVTSLAGFGAGADEHKLQWLSAWGKPNYAGLLRQVIRSDESSLLTVDQSYFVSGRQERGGFSEKFFHDAGWKPSEPLTEEARADLAASMQLVLEEIVLEISQRIAAQTKVESLALSGGVALNPLLIERLESCGLFREIFVQPAAGNAGTALGAALYCAHGMLNLSARQRLEHMYFGPQYSGDEIKEVLDNCKLDFRYLPTRGDLVAATVEALQKNRIVGWFQGRAEFGPRALGARSILASPLGPYVNENLNDFVKHREKFRPFAVSVQEEKAGEFFAHGPMAKYLASLGKIKPAYREKFAANVLPPRPEAEGSSGEGRIRVHVVSRKTNSLLWDLLGAFGKASGLPVLFNTSFNLFGEPLVCSPRDAVRSFYCSGIDDLTIGNFLLSK